MTTTAETTTTTTTPVATAPVYRVYIGNLTANVKEEQLKESFAKFGDVSNIKIVKKPKQTFGFVDMSNEDAAKVAIEKLNKTEIDSQQVDVELAKTERPKRGRPTQKPRRPRAPKTVSATTDATSPVATTATDASAPATNGKPKRKSNKPRKSRKPSTPKTPTATDAPAAKKQQSSTTLYVRNIPFSFDDAQLLEAFKEYTPKSAHVIINKITKKSRGYGFVEFDDVSNREKALEMDKKIIAEREILVKIALVPEHNDTTKEATTPDTTTTTA
ncbi:hypothetical protein CYY_006884 [Polysphondylium violaceum]|uniref:RRM domain-containing protein n=1 Tax=Polysphondylium violaceum TaxID=133409 RepID=A0A8J4PPF3_9MYCE|nr:hypothetical protein CYY_006884 [Polysphondylium violaceum]